MKPETVVDNRLFRDELIGASELSRVLAFKCMCPLGVCICYQLLAGFIFLGHVLHLS